MKRTTIDFGIDLGTTNSAIAVANGTDIAIIKNNEGQETTPSVVWIDRSGGLRVGRKAKERLEDDPENAYAEFKLLMGFVRDYRFVRSGRMLTPEEMSAEVLKSLRADVQQRMNEDISAAVITIPAAFESNQREATQRAAQLAGFTVCPLLQEPVAAAMMYNFQRHTDRAFWLVYDFGGGTFDAAVIEMQDGNITVVNHSGDNNLGGKLIDWVIVEELFIPKLLKDHRLTDFRRGNHKWRGAIAKLKQKAEETKISLSRETSVYAEIPNLCRDDHGNDIDFEFEFHRADLERLTEPFIVRTINTCRNALDEKGLKPKDIQKLVLVGGPTLMPYLRGRLEDPRAGLGIPLDFRVDPLTVVAQGAALFACKEGTVADPKIVGDSLKQGLYAVRFPAWKYSGSESESAVGGIVEAPAGRSAQGFTVEFTNNGTQPPWRSAKIPIQANGAFSTVLLAAPGVQNRFQLELYDRTGSSQNRVTDPESLTYIVGGGVESTILTLSIGVALVNNEVQWFMEKGTKLPKTVTHTLRTAFELDQRVTGSAIRIPVVEGGKARADRNKRVGQLEITAQQLSVKRVVPIDSEIEVTLEVDRAGLFHVSAYIPLINEKFEGVLKWGGADTIPDLAQMVAGLEQQRQRLADLRYTTDSHVQEIIRRIDEEHIVAQVEAELGAAQDNPDSLPAANSRLLKLTSELDNAEDNAKWPKLVVQAEEMIAVARDMINQFGTMAGHETLRKIEGDIRRAVQMRDVELLERQVSALRALLFRILDDSNFLPVFNFDHYVEAQAEMSDPAQARDLITQGMLAKQEANFPKLRDINRRLAKLLPRPIPSPTDSGVFGRKQA